MRHQTRGHPKKKCLTFAVYNTQASMAVTWQCRRVRGSYSVLDNVTMIPRQNDALYTQLHISAPIISFISVTPEIHSCQTTSTKARYMCVCVCIHIHTHI